MRLAPGTVVDAILGESSSVSESQRAELEHELLTTFAETTIRSQQTQQMILSPAATVKAIDDSVPHVECDEASYATRLKTTATTDEELPSWEDYHDLEQEGLEK